MSNRLWFSVHCQVVESFDKGDHMGRNAQLGPDARYFKLQPEEEELVEKLLQVR